MLSLIKVRNYAVIDEVEVEFQTGLSVMTGETGAGKSILVDALGLTLGERADANAVRPGADRAEISALFECPDNHPAIKWLREHGLDEEHCCLLRRVINSEGRSRAFINTHPVTRQDLRTLGAFLVNIHGQSSHQALLRGPIQRKVLDHHGGHQDLANQVSALFKAWQALQEKLSLRTQDADNHTAQLELLRFQAQELEELNLQDGELEPLTAERNRLANVDRLMNSLDSVLIEIYENDALSAYELIANAQRTLDGLVELDSTLTEPTKLLGEAEIQIREAASELARYRDRLEPDPPRLDHVDARLAKTRDLSSRHNVEPENLHSMLNTVNAQIEELEGTSESLDTLVERAEQARTAYFEAAEQLSTARKNSANTLSKTVSKQVIELGLPHGRFHTAIRAKPEEQADGSGLDQIEFQVALNPGQELGPLTKVASGGELSRISLALEVVSAGITAVPTLVFDEVDAGIGGGVAEVVGRRLAEIATQRQVLCVTHLAQVASQGPHHYRVVKLTDGHTTRTSVRELGSDERVEELSRMLGGVEITDKTRAHAEEMIGRAAR
jgi:DNA repair protein RecN (Recombination protein N)